MTTEMHIESGLKPFQVLQRTRAGVAVARVTGGLACSGTGDVFAAVRRRGRAIPGFPRKKAGRFAAGRWSAELKGLPNGGPYDVVFEAGPKERVVVHGILVGDVWFLAGQSNMQGMGNIADAPAPDPLMKGFQLAYGYEIDAACNVRDADDMALPAFGPVPIEPLKSGRSREDNTQSKIRHGTREQQIAT